MKKIKFKKWIPPKKEQCINEGYYTYVKGTNCFEEDYVHEGIFHTWGLSYEEFNDGIGSFTVGIVEQANGEIIEVLPQNIKFIN